MSYTNQTAHYALPQYVATDKPKYLTDFNETMQAIDTQMYTNATAAATAQTAAEGAQSTADGAVSSIGTLNTQINGDPTDPSDTGLAGDVSGLEGDVNTIQSLLGSGSPTTSDQTIIGAVNGLEGAIAPREDGADLANSYAIGAQFARGGSVYTALTALAAGTAFASLTLNTDYKNSDTLVEQIANIPIVPNGYVLDSISTLDLCAGDGVKDFETLFSDCIDTLNTFLAGLDDGVGIYADRLFVARMGNFVPFTSSLFTNNSTVNEIGGVMTRVSPTDLDMSEIIIKKSSPRFTRLSGITSTPAIANKLTDVLAEGDKIQLRYFKVVK